VDHLVATHVNESNGGARPRRILLGAFGDPGHAFPMIALGRALAARGHDVTLQTWERWRTDVEAEGMRFAAAPEYQAFPNGEPGSPPLDFYEAVVHATRDTLPLVRELEPEVVVADILTLAPALAAELQGVPFATLIPHVHPHPPEGAPIYSIGARLPRTALGRAFWRRATRPVAHGLEHGRRDLNAVRARVGLPPLAYVHGGTSRQLALVATFPQLEYPRAQGGLGVGRRSGRGSGWAGGWAANTHVVGPLMWEPPTAEVELPPGDGPLVLIAPSTAQDPGHRLLGAALRGLATAPVRVLATWNRRLPSRPLPVPANARVVEWLSYARTMPRCDLVVCHAGHGTLVRALSSGCAVLACPAAGDMSENAARLEWAGAGVRLPRRFIAPRPLRLAVERALGDPAIGARARELAAWSAAHDPAGTAAALVERLAASGHGTPSGPTGPYGGDFEALGVGLEPTTLRLTAECSAD
jgi:UDP:flavonoid glycosyltransferase YjiC (YdhE family)